MNEEIRKRLAWVKLYEEIGNAGIVCRRCGISRPTLRKWLNRYKEVGIDGLQSRSRRPRRLANQKIFAEQQQQILSLRKRRLGSRRIQSELIRLHNQRYARATIHKALVDTNQPPLRKSRRPRKTKHRYERPVPGDRVQIDTCQTDTNLIQYTAIDDCTRIKVLALYDSKSEENSLMFLDHLIEEMPFPIQRIQTDRGQEFFAYKFQEKLMEYGIKFRPIKPRSPHLNEIVKTWSDTCNKLSMKLSRRVSNDHRRKNHQE